MPLFTTENGAASLVLREIPYRKRAYIRLLDSLTPDVLLQECISFCRACGAEEIYAEGKGIPETYALHTRVLQMQRPLEGLDPGRANLFPVTEKTGEQWRKIYNEKMNPVPNAAYMDSRDLQEMLQKGDGYFVHREGVLLGIGRAGDGRIDAVISLVPGAGETVVKALCELLHTDLVTLQVASANGKAIRLYERLGFMPVKELSRWYRVL